ncbi:MAG TPA: mechanosensitive ion channel family protein [Pseudolabrys sp.]|jgi:small-conductance mechanosensitive channel|nr:mechanosensitive ion channel family protein [Pseudolabrys sp.]
MDSLRNALNTVRIWLDWLPDPIVAVLILLIAIAIALVLHRLLRKASRRLLAARYPNLFSVVTQMRGLSRLALFILGVFIALPVAPIDYELKRLIARFLLMAIIALVGWSAIAALHITADIYLRRYRLDVEDNLLARKHNTQIRVLLRSIDVILVLFTVGAALMTFQTVRQYGVSLFASAGVAGIIAGLAARPVFSNLMAGVQLAMTQPIRLEDAVIVENEYGNVEEIGSTYVVLRLWDLRRMIVPLTYFIEKPFQNWTRESSTLIGTVLMYLDYRTPVAALRNKAEEIVRASNRWDGRVFNVAVTDFKNDTMEVRILASAGNAGAVFDLRCEIREKLIDFLQREHPEVLPRQRTELAVDKAAKAGSSVTITAVPDKPAAGARGG